MRDWLKYFGLSFFSETQSRKADSHGWGNFLLSFILAAALLFAGMLAADLLPFGVGYDCADEFKAFVENAFACEDEAQRINLEISAGKLRACKGGDGYDGALVADSFDKSGEGAAYSFNGYDLVVDARASSAYDRFEAYCLANDGSGLEIAYEEWLALSDAAKRGFDFKIRYTAEELVLTPGLTASHEAYLDGLELSDGDAQIIADYKSAKGDESLSAEEYAEKVYALYLQAYYPDMSGYESGGVPLLRNYYLYNYLSGGREKFLMVFSDMCVGSFETYGGRKTDFYGYFGKTDDGAVNAPGLSAAQAAESVHDFFKGSFYSAAPVSAYLYFSNMIRLLPVYVLEPLAVALFAFCAFRLMKSRRGRTYGECIKTVGSYMWASALFGGLALAVLGFIIGRENVFITSIVCLFIVMLIRTSVTLVAEYIAAKREENKEENDKENQINSYNREMD